MSDPATSPPPVESEARASVASSTNETIAVVQAQEDEPDFTPITKDFGFLPIPKHLRHDPKHPAYFGLLLNATFGFAGTFVQFSHTFNVSYDTVSRIPTLVQVGYAVGLLLISTLGDLVRRRPLIIMLVFICASLSIGLSFTTNFAVFQALCFLTGVFTVVPQILLPLAADLAPPERRATALSIVLSGLLLGILLARVLAGVIAQFVSWRVVYYLAFSVQYVVCVWLYLVLPDYPAKNKGATYFGLLWGMAKFAVTEPQLVQAVLISIPSAACYTNFWVTLTFLLGGPPYNYSTLVIGLFGLVGMVGVGLAPPLGRLIDSLVPWFASVIACIAYIITHVIMVGADGVNVAAVVIVCIGIDVFRQMVQVSLTTAVFSLDPAARSRMNAIILISLFIGQIMGTAVGSEVYTQHGWRPAAALNLAWSGLMLFVVLARGPHVSRYTWVGWEGGLEVRKSKVTAQKRRDEEAGASDIQQGGDEKHALEEKQSVREEKDATTVGMQEVKSSETREGEKQDEDQPPIVEVATHSAE
ncbi:hypothetical protein POSPLADRAFT_1061821 [Postia placenta MAD-698-R-SB12]|uniref:Major facilitator superfamily (MFS) profile domain-containing protein n=1 Tax=Postia placenta MAD-698-R-SB12 TaxID=670580 RepID=A0A1X6ML64_9APHY|nr:hypothetical protein POSPLADRAFT_1061821 [Postia placenta MAD-698-R-SB12]OSX57124.1 hypothetical protein POSPLADRAFT_1061821 [Postia placenta MAD-698-R-SB12]